LFDFQQSATKSLDNLQLNKMETTQRRTSGSEQAKPVQVPIQGAPKRTEPLPEKRTLGGEYGKEGKFEGGELRLSKALRCLGVTSIRSVEITNRQYLGSGVHMYIKNRQGIYENVDVSHFLNHADLRLSFTLPLDANPDELTFAHEKSGCPMNPLQDCQCTIHIGMLENVGDMEKEREFNYGRSNRVYSIELPFLRNLPVDPYVARFYTIRIGGLKFPQQTEIYWRIHIKVCQAEDTCEVISITDHPFDVNVVQENFTNLSNRLNNLVYQPLKRRGWLNFPWGKKGTSSVNEGTQFGESQRFPPTSAQLPKEQQQPAQQEGTASHRV